MQKKLKIVFMGTSDLAGIILESLLEKKYSITAVITQPDYKEKVKAKIVSPVKKVALENKLQILQPTKLDKNFAETIEKLQPDLIIVAAYGKILPTEILEIPKFKSINVHASLLPKWRGPSPIQNTLLNNENETGVTIMLMDEGIDTGDILSKKSVKINSTDNYITLTSKLAILATELLKQTVPKWIAKKIKPKTQDLKQATMCQLIEKNDGKIIWDNDAEIIFNQFRAFYLWPEIFTFWEKDKKKILKVALSEIELEKDDPLEDYKFGEVFQYPDKRIGVKTGAGVIIIKKIQLAGKTKTKISDFLNGYPDFVGSVLK